MNSDLHILLSRFLAIAFFGMVFVLTPRAWVEPKPMESIPVQALEPSNNDYCFWCSSSSTNCPKSNDFSKPSTKKKSTSRTWLNPDAQLRPVDLRPCLSEDLTDTDSATESKPKLVL